MNGKKWLLSIAILMGLTLVPAQAYAGCGDWDLRCKAGEALKWAGDQAEKAGKFIKEKVPIVGTVPGTVIEYGGKAVKWVGEQLSPTQTVSTKDYPGCPPNTCCPGPTTKSPPPPLVPVNKVTDYKKQTVAAGKEVEEAAKKLTQKGKTTSGKPGIDLGITTVAPVITKDGNVVGNNGNNIGKVGPDGNVVDKNGNVVGQVDSNGTFTPGLQAAKEGGFFNVKPGSKNGPGGPSDLSGAGFGKITGKAMEGGGVPVGFIKHKPTGADGAQKGGGGGSFNAPEAKAGQGSASVGLNAKFAGDGSFVGGGQGVASGLGIGSGGGIQRGPSVADAEKSVPEIPVDGPPQGQGAGLDSKSGLGESAAGREGEAPGAGEEGQGGDISRAVGLMRNQEGLSGELGTLVNTALKMIELRDWDSAIKALNKAIELAPNNPLLYVYRATAFNLSGDYVSAERDARKAIELDPDNSPAYEALSWSLLRQEKYDEAIQTATRAIELDPQSAMPWAIRAYAKQMLGDLTGMLEDIKQAAALDPRFKPQYEAALKGGKIYDPAIKDELYILGPAKGRKGGGAGGGGVMAFFLLLLGSAGAAGAMLYRKRAKKAAAEGKKLDLNFLLKGEESKPLVKK